tara:strand:- start:526 stop:765 length:240 start_codon:yes stop_codon:yes gene_type:complete
MSALKIFLTQFYNDPIGIEEYKINFLKNHYYDIINSKLNIEFNDMLIGINNNPDILYFKSKTKNIEPIKYNIKDDIFIE